MPFIRVGQTYILKNLGIKINIWDSCYRITDADGESWNMCSYTRRRWLDWLYYQDKRAHAPMTVEDIRKVYLSDLDITKWVKAHGDEIEQDQKERAQKNWND